MSAFNYKNLDPGIRRLVVASGYVAMFRKQREIERARIVALLRASAGQLELGSDGYDAVVRIADGIEGGE